VAIINLFEQEVHEIREVHRVEHFVDPSQPACIVLVRFVLWYGAARKIPQSAEQSQKQLKEWKRLCGSLSQFYPGKDFSFMKKFHNAGEHVHTVGFAFGGWELASTNSFEILNKFMKATVRQHTNYKEYEKQV